MTKPNLLGIVSEWWQWSKQDIADFRAWAELNREEAVAWLRLEAQRVLAMQEAGHRCADDWFAFSGPRSGAH